MSVAVPGGASAPMCVIAGLVAFAIVISDPVCADEPGPHADPMLACETGLLSGAACGGDPGMPGLDAGTEDPPDGLDAGPPDAGQDAGRRTDAGPDENCWSTSDCAPGNRCARISGVGYRCCYDLDPSISCGSGSVRLSLVEVGTERRFGTCACVEGGGCSYEAPAMHPGAVAIRPLRRTLPLRFRPVTDPRTMRR